MTMKYRLDRRAALGLLGGSAASVLIPVPGARVNAQTLDKVSYQTNWRAQTEHGGFYLAATNGIYKKYGIEVDIRPGGPQQNPTQLLLGGRVDMIMGNSLEALSFWDKAKDEVKSWTGDQDAEARRKADHLRDEVKAGRGGDWQGNDDDTGWRDPVSPGTEAEVDHGSQPAETREHRPGLFRE